MAMEDPMWIATFRAVFHAADEVGAILVADKIMENGSRDLDEEDGATLNVMQVTNNTLDLQPEEVLGLLRRARNSLIRTRMRSAFDVAQELDKVIHQLEMHTEPGYELANYDYGRFIEISAEVLEGGNPTR